MTWEAHMASRASEREREHAAAAVPRRPAWPWDDDPYVLGQQLGEAVELLDGSSWACACCGPPNCCVNRWAQARLLRRGAHVVARQLADLLAQRSEEEVPVNFKRCPQCGGNGKSQRGAGDGVCFWCLGAGHVPEARP